MHNFYENIHSKFHNEHFFGKNIYFDLNVVKSTLNLKSTFVNCTRHAYLFLLITLRHLYFAQHLINISHKNVVEFFIICPYFPEITLTLSLNYCFKLPDKETDKIY